MPQRVSWQSSKKNAHVIYYSLHGTWQGGRQGNVAEVMNMHTSFTLHISPYRLRQGFCQALRQVSLFILIDVSPKETLDVVHNG